MSTVDADSDLLRALVEDAPDALILSDAAGRIVLVNAQAERLFGYGRAELVGLTIEVLVPDASRARHARLREEYREAPRRRSMGALSSLVGRRRDGTEVAIEIALSPVTSRGARLIAASVRDVTAIRGVERARDLAESALRGLAEASPDGIFVANLAGRYIDVNPAGCRMLGYSRDELLAKTVMELVPEDEHQRLEEQKQALLVPGTELVEEWRLRRKDGEFLIVEVSASILTDGRWQAFVRDISARKELERQREQATRLLELVLDQSPVGIAMISEMDAEPRLLLNRRGRELYGQSLETGALAAWTRTTQHADGSAVDSATSPIARVLRGEHVGEIELVIMRDDGSRTPIRSRGAPIVNDEGGVCGGVIVFEDISAQKQLEQLATEWNAVVAHDLRNPLNNIGLHAHVLRRRARHDGNLAESVAEIEASVARLNRMVRDLLDISRLESRRFEVDVGPVDVRAIAMKALERARLAAPEHAFELRASDADHVAQGDADRIAQVLDNLLSNAIRYGSGDEPIVVEIRSANGAIGVYVTNHGPGLAPSSTKSLFQRFQRTEEGKLTGVKGIGLGLYIARELVEAQGGNIAVDSRPEGPTTFSFTLPAPRDL